MGNKQTIVPEDDMKKIRDTTNLTQGEIRHLYKRFQSFFREGDNNLLRKFNLLAYTDVRQNPIQSELLQAMFGNKTTINFAEFAIFLSNFKATNENLSPKMLDTRRNKQLKILFDMYDADKDGILSKEELIIVVYKMFSPFMDNADIVRAVEVMLMEADQSKTGQMLFNDFCMSIQKLDLGVKLIMKFPESP